MFRQISKVLIFAILINGLVSAQSFAEVFEVPSAFATITSALEAADDGDSIRVAPGHYVENIDFLGKEILVTSHYVDGGDWNLVETTIIDGSAADDVSRASTVSFRSGEGPQSILQGFTITGGSGTVWVDPQFPTYAWRGGGGIFCFQSSPTIRFNIITGNTVSFDSSIDGAQAGGVLCFGGNPLIQNTIITRNEAQYGGGLVIDYSGGTVRNTIITHNTGGSSYGGGGLWTIGNGAAPIEFENVVIANNNSPTRGGAIYAWTTRLSLRNTIIWGNEQVFGGPIATTNGGVVTIEYSDIEGGYEGQGNLDLDPVFVDLEHYLLEAASPLVDAGDPALRYNDREHSSNPGSALPPSLATVRNDMGAYGGPGARAFEESPPAATESWFVPAVIHAPGAAGTQWRTTLTCLNLGADEAAIELTLLLELDNEVQTHLLQPGASVEWNDVVVDLFGRSPSESNSGAMRLVSTGTILVTSRIYNQAEIGTFGQAMPALSVDHCLKKDEHGYLMQLKNNNSFRTNIGIANLSLDEGDVWLQLYDDSGAMIGNGLSILISGESWTQVNDVFSATGAGNQNLAYATATIVNDASIWVYASVVDARTGDATTVPVLIK